jgi:hypothetical protein
VPGWPCGARLGPLWPRGRNRSQAVGRSTQLVAGDPQEAIHAVHDAGVSGKE